jgi:hypothetical protein
MSDFMDESYAAADEVIEDVLAATGKDYSAVREEIAGVFDGYLFHGVWDMSTGIENTELKDLRFIQEDEYDQRMDDDPDKPDWDSQICYSAGHYVFFV